MTDDGAGASGRERGAQPAPDAGGRLLLGWALVGLGALFLFIGWFGVSGEPDVARQMAYLVSGGLGGILCGVVGVGLLISNDVRKDRERLGRVEAAILEIRDMVAAQADLLGGNGSGARRAGAETGEERVEPPSGAGRAAGKGGR